MYNEQIEALISAALADGVLTEKEKQILFKKAESMGIDLDEFEMVLYKPRTWCAFCPMGTMTQGICKLKNKE